MLSVGLATGTTLSQIFLDHSSNISYGVRYAPRIDALPKDRILDYYLRDFYMTVMTAFAFESSFRTMESLYTIPLLSKYLKLNRLSELYQHKVPNNLPVWNYNTLPQPVLRRFLGSARSQSMMHIPRLLEVDLKLDQIRDPVEKANAQTLLRHFYSRLDFEQYLQRYKNVSAGDAELIKKACKDAFKEALGQHEGKGAQGKQKWLNKLNGLFRPVHWELDDKVMQELEAKVLGKLPALHYENLSKLVRHGLQSEQTMAVLGKIQKSAGWPKIALATVINIIYFGIAGNWFDVNILQPWQKKVSEERGGVHELVEPAFLSLIPGAAVWGLLNWPKLANKIGLNKLGYASRFCLVGLAGLGTYSVATWAFVKQRLESLRKNKPIYRPSMPPNYPGLKPASAQRTLTPQTSGTPFVQNRFAQLASGVQR